MVLILTRFEGQMGLDYATINASGVTITPTDVCNHLWHPQQLLIPPYTPIVM